MSDTSEDEFEGFSAGEIELACQRYQVQLAQNGIGDDFLISDIESELSDDNNDEPQLVDINNAGDAPNNDGWHQEFDIYERGLPHLFQPRNTTGPQNILGPEKDIIDFFQLFLSDHLLQQIIEKSDGYAKLQKDLNPDLHKSAWSCPSLPEMKAFIGLTFLMGIDVKPDLKSYWSKDCLETPYFATVLARDRFMQIMRYLHFTDPHQRVPQRGEPNYDSTYKVRYFMDALNQQMRDQYIPKRNVSIDECMIPYKGRVALKQYMPAKPTKWGIKLWALAESDTGEETVNLGKRGQFSATVWKDKKNVSVISTIHDNSLTEVSRIVQQEGQFQRQQLQCPKMVADYTSHMGGVDRCDQYIQYYFFCHKTNKWPKRVFFKMLEIIKFNAYRLLQMSPNHQQTTSMTYLDFSKSVATQLIAGYTTRDNRRGRPSNLPVEVRLTHRHLPADLGNKTWCHVCWHRVANDTQEKRRQTKYGCVECSKHLCMPQLL
ncbi:piggyBac transposable element-derived protein 4-like [Mytilus edulis]|uniref:piggyBac transposable element-derived protein 4-like n=1 Tax=Mytilus edulis TaxID=6550 RepID=UPI0039EFD660